MILFDLGCFAFGVLPQSQGICWLSLAVLVLSVSRVVVFQRIEVVWLCERLWALRDSFDTTRREREYIVSFRECVYCVCVSEIGVVDTTYSREGGTLELH